MLLGVVLAQIKSRSFFLLQNNLNRACRIYGLSAGANDKSELGYTLFKVSLSPVSKVGIEVLMGQLFGDVPLEIMAWSIKKRGSQGVPVLF
ncbi:hypothetical protein [Iodobacter ciconiae]|uniref:hypothetical protein n=1 Tax=Iodobacter ciconiae TaxID=2496266 RepID=UPI001F37B99A|nr:hypothetical protein [Iodobacter ciconiae]